MNFAFCFIQIAQQGLKMTFSQQNMIIYYFMKYVFMKLLDINVADTDFDAVVADQKFQ